MLPWLVAKSPSGPTCQGTVTRDIPMSYTLGARASTRGTSAPVPAIGIRSSLMPGIGSEVTQNLIWDLSPGAVMLYVLLLTAVYRHRFGRIQPGGRHRRPGRARRTGRHPQHRGTAWTLADVIQTVRPRPTR